jgi:hypothetical protein
LYGNGSETTLKLKKPRQHITLKEPALAFLMFYKAEQNNVFYDMKHF